MATTADPLQQDALVAALVPAPDELKDLRLLFGWLGRSGREGTWRLYFTPELDHYVEIQENDILYSRQLAEGGASVGGTMLWVRRDIRIPETRIGSQRAQVSFLDGDILALLRRADAQTNFDLSAVAGQTAATTLLCFTAAVTAGVIIGVGVSKINDSCKKIRSQVFPSQC